MDDGNEWSYIPWLSSERIALRFSELLETQPAQVTFGNKLPDFIRYAEMSYLACRILMISSMAVHPPALYMAGQTVEKYLKALLLKLHQDPPKTHNLRKLAGRVHASLLEFPVVQQAAGRFDDIEFLRLCDHLGHFDNAGRYPPEKIGRWRYSLNLLAFLDEFVVRCRELIGVSRNTPNVVAELLEQEPNDNLVMAAAITAVRDNNHRVEELLTPPLPSKAVLSQAFLTEAEAESVRSLP
jgi:HEPN domain-containing protein